MLGSDILDIGIGVALFFLFVSLMCSAARELLEVFLKHRAADLERGIRSLLDDADGAKTVRTLFEHPRISALFLGRYTGGAQHALALAPRSVRKDLPSYIPATQFADALIDIVARGQQNAYAINRALTAADLRSAAENFPNQAVRRALISALDAAQDNLERARANISQWYDDAMERVSGGYKRRTQKYLFIMGLLVAVVFNLDAISVMRQLQTSPALQQAATAAAQGLIGDTSAARTSPEQAADGDGEAQQAPPLDAPAGAAPAEVDPRAADENANPQPGLPAPLVNNDLESIVAHFAPIGYAVGWGECADRRLAQMREGDDVPNSLQCPRDTLGWLSKLAGWLITALAVTLGAPFWFDILNKFMRVRSAVRPAPPPEPEPAAPSPTRGGAASPQPQQDTAADVAFVPNEWASGNSQEGLA